VTATLHLLREKSAAIELRRGPFNVFLDGNDVATIDMHGAVDLPIEPGRHTLQVKRGRSSSGQRSFIAADGAIVNFRCNSARIWPIYLASLVVPSLGLKLQPE
jgi:hypothetical protein